MTNFNNYAFIDGQNLYISIKKFDYEFSYEKFFIFLKNNLYVTKAFYFIGYTENRNCQMYKELRNIGFQLSLRKPVYRFKYGQKKIKANVDSNLITHTLIKIQSYDKAVLVAGDGDYYLTAKYLLRNQKLHRLLVPHKSDCSDLFKNTIFMNHISYINRMDKILSK
jgi:uncharacterized LabA/DUF88 family protein